MTAKAPELVRLGAVESFQLLAFFNVRLNVDTIVVEALCSAPFSQNDLCPDSSVKMLTLFFPHR